jgi:hypothetical protein
MTFPSSKPRAYTPPQPDPGPAAVNVTLTLRDAPVVEALPYTRHPETAQQIRESLRAQGYRIAPTDDELMARADRRMRGGA